MPHTIKLAPHPYTGLRPRTRAERRSLVEIAGMIAALLLAFVGFWSLQRHWEEIRELTWRSSAGTIEDVRPVLAGEFDGKYGGGMLYKVEVLVKFSIDGVMKEQWIAVRQRPEGLADVKFQAFRWCGSKCVVRWNPSNASQVVVEIV